MLSCARRRFHRAIRSIEATFMLSEAAGGIAARSEAEPAAQACGAVERRARRLRANEPPRLRSMVCAALPDGARRPAQASGANFITR